MARPGNIHTNFGFSKPFRFQLRSSCRTDRQTGKTHNVAY